MFDQLDSLRKNIEGINQASNLLSEANEENEKTSFYLKKIGRDITEINKTLNLYVRVKPDLSEIAADVSENARELSYIALLKEKPQGEA